jgi:hypothetical protein
VRVVNHACADDARGARSRGLPAGVRCRADTGATAHSGDGGCGEVEGGCGEVEGGWEAEEGACGGCEELHGRAGGGGVSKPPPRLSAGGRRARSVVVLGRGRGVVT